MTNKIGYSLAIGMAIFVTEATANIDEIVKLVGKDKEKTPENVLAVS